MALIVIKNWDNKTWLSSTNYINSFNKFLIKNIDINSKSKVLDIGCGRGKILGSLSKELNLKNKPLGIDIINHKDKDKRISFKKINAIDFSLKNKQKFDLILIKQTIHLMKLYEIIKSFERDRKILKIITRLYPSRTKKTFVYNVKIQKKKYLEMIENRYISTLIPLTKKQLVQGIQEINLKYKNILRFKDKLICIIL